MDVEKIKSILLKEFGIRSYEELEKAMEEDDGIDIGLFVAPRKEVCITA